VKTTSEGKGPIGKENTKKKQSSMLRGSAAKEGESPTLEGHRKKRKKERRSTGKEERYLFTKERRNRKPS